MGSVVDNILSVATGGVSDIIKGENPLEATLAVPGKAIEATTFGLVDRTDLVGLGLTSVIDPLGALYFGGKQVIDKLSSEDPIQAGVTTDVPGLDPNARRQLLARQFGEEDPSRKRKKKTKKTKKSQFKRERKETTSGVTADTTKTTGLQL